MKNFSIILLLLIGLSVQAQFPRNYRPNNSREAVPYRIEMDYDSGLLVTGTGYFNDIDSGSEMVKMDANGNKRWFRNLKNGACTDYTGCRPSKDGGYYVFGSTILSDTTGDAYLCKLNPCGELVWGKIFQINEWNFINDVVELSEQQLLIMQTGSSFGKQGWFYSHVGLYNTDEHQYKKQKLIPIEPIGKKITFNNGLFYRLGTWIYLDKNDPNVGILGTSLVAFDAELSKFKIKAFAAETRGDKVPLFWSPPTFLPGGNLVLGGDIIGVRSNIGYPMSFAKLNPQLNWTESKDMGHIRTPNCAELVEHTVLTGDNRLIAVVDVDFYQNSPNIFNSQTEVYLLDTNFKEINVLKYGDTANYKYYTHDILKDHEGNFLLLMNRYKNQWNIEYELIKIDKNLNLVTEAVPNKLYDYKCLKAIDTFGTIDLATFDTIVMSDWDHIAENTDLEAPGTINCKLYPNPAQDHIRVQFEQDLTGTASVYDVTGRILKSISFSNQNELLLNLSDFENGLFFLQIKSEQGQLSKTWIFTKE